ncbi:MAG: UDP-N-acetylmuramoyl-L-alanyl-D-glutamate--2,6-diaminopimelate ligase [Endomicrobium sp.]|jgi:UDP-N-acetylmuramoyl-L-alanyl-D-glutamate--2,6-diaminopimelate ligase|nr:UDP-N-acetylmuramoyl-L-alanyl-D-glutamate--2,6-diaminopimelate ligase [Endomicrobium sp.]
MKLKEILSDVNVIIIGNDDVNVTGISYDSRTISKDCAFFALPGHNTDGRKYINEAIKKGASVVITDLKYDLISAVQVVVENIFIFMAVFCAKFYNYPDRELNIIGITGTNGKTTIAYMIESIFAGAGIDCGVIGTINYRYKENVISALNTTPQSPDIYKIMRDMIDNGVKYLVMEVSSHALSLHRVYGIDFDTVVFTNLTQDHLDFHKTMNNYFKAKSMLFIGSRTDVKRNKKYAIINADDKYGKKLSKVTVNSEVKLYAIEDKEVEFKAENVEMTSNGGKFDLLFGDKRAKVNIKHIGLHNIYNALAASAVSICNGISFNKIAEGLSASKQVPGRLEKIDTKNFGFDVILDYAHTNDALKNVLCALKKMHPKRIITVFGCGGDRDRTKRPVMGKIAVEMSDFVFVTSDNPRTEDPNNIALDIEVGIKKTYRNNYKVIIDRENAIREAIMMANKGDVILLAGKGHETYQVIGTQRVHFSDIEIANKYIILKEEEKKSKLKEMEQKEFIF